MTQTLPKLVNLVHQLLCLATMNQTLLTSVNLLDRLLCFPTMNQTAAEVVVRRGSEKLPGLQGDACCWRVQRRGGRDGRGSGGDEKDSECVHPREGGSSCGRASLVTRKGRRQWQNQRLQSAAEEVVSRGSEKLPGWRGDACCWRVQRRGSDRVSRATTNEDKRQPGVTKARAVR